MEIHVLGSGTAIPAEGHSPAGYLVIAGGISLVMDLGPGTVQRLAKAGVSYTGLDYALLSHLHPDHTLDLAILLQDFNSTPGWTRSKDFTLVGCKGTQEFIDRLFRLYPNVVPDHYQLIVQEVENEDFTLAGLHFRSAPTGHTATSVAYRLEEGGRGLVYSGDASPNSRVASLADGADLLISECSFPAGWETHDHLNADSLGQLVRQAGVKSLLVTHRYPPALEADLVSQLRAYYAGPIQLASDGLRIDLG